MLVKQTIYLLSLFFFTTSIITLKFAIKNKKKNVCKYIIELSIIYIIFSIFTIDFLPFTLNLSISFEILFHRAFLLITIILFIISIIISNKKLKKIEIVNDSKKEKIFLLLLIISPIIIFSFSYFREIYYINKSNLILVYEIGDEFDAKDIGYAINDNYCKKISIGIDFRGYELIEYLPKEFNEFHYSWADDNVKINNNRIIIYEKNKISYEGKVNCDISTYGLESYFINENNKQ